MSDVTESIGKYIYGYTRRPKVDDLTTMTDNFITVAGKMDTFFDNITDDRKREAMKRNVSLAVQLMVDNMELYNEWLKIQSMEKK